MIGGARGQDPGIERKQASPFLPLAHSEFHQAQRRSNDESEPALPPRLRRNINNTPGGTKT
jgi:hypothetical protein